MYNQEDIKASMIQKIVTMKGERVSRKAMRTKLDTNLDMLQVASLASAGVPITFDFHHHRFCTGDMTEEQAFKAAIATWPKGVRPQVMNVT